MSWKPRWAAKIGGGITVSGLPQSQGEWQAYPWLSSQGFTYESPDEQALPRASRWSTAGWRREYLSKEATTWDQTVPFQQFLAGQSLFAANGNWQIALADSDATFEYGGSTACRRVRPGPSEAKVRASEPSRRTGARMAVPDSSTYYSAEGQSLQQSNPSARSGP